MLFCVQMPSVLLCNVLVISDIFVLLGFQVQLQEETLEENQAEAVGSSES